MVARGVQAFELAAQLRLNALYATQAAVPAPRDPVRLDLGPAGLGRQLALPREVHGLRQGGQLGVRARANAPAASTATCHPPQPAHAGAYTRWNVNVPSRFRSRLGRPGDRRSAYRARPLVRERRRLPRAAPVRRACGGGVAELPRRARGPARVERPAPDRTPPAGAADRLVVVAARARARGPCRCCRRRRPRSRCCRRRARRGSTSPSLAVAGCRRRRSGCAGCGAGVGARVCPRPGGAPRRGAWPERPGGPSPGAPAPAVRRRGRRRRVVVDAGASCSPALIGSSDRPTSWSTSLLTPTPAPPASIRPRTATVTQAARGIRLIGRSSSTGQLRTARAPAALAVDEADLGAPLARQLGGDRQAQAAAVGPRRPAEPRWKRWSTSSCSPSSRPGPRSSTSIRSGPATISTTVPGVE